MFLYCDHLPVINCLVFKKDQANVACKLRSLAKSSFLLFYENGSFLKYR